MEEINGLMPEGNVEYTEDNIRHLDDMEHIRVRSGMYIGRLGDGTQNDDGIYVLLKEVMDNSIDEFKMGAGRRIEINIEDNLRVSVRDYGRGIPQGKLIEAVSKLNTGGKYDSKAFKKSVGLNGVGIKAVNALSSRFEVRSYREGKVRIAIFEKGNLQSDVTESCNEESGTYIFFEPDSTLFLNYSFQANFVETLLRNYTYLNTGLSIIYNGQRIISRHGLEDLLNDNMTAQGLYNLCTPVSTAQVKPGDLVFFKGTYDTPGVSHCGIYVGNSIMLHCGDPISYTNLNSKYWQEHFYSYGRLP